MAPELTFARVAAIARQLKAGNIEKLIREGADTTEIGMGQDFYMLRRGKILGSGGVPVGGDGDNYVDEAVVVLPAVLGGDEMFLSEDILGQYGDDVYQAVQLHRFTAAGFDLGTYRYDVVPPGTNNLVWTLITTMETTRSDHRWNLFRFGLDLRSSYAKLSTNERGRLVSTFDCIRDYMPREAQAEWCWKNGEIETRPEEWHQDAKLEGTIRYLKNERKGGVLPET